MLIIKYVYNDEIICTQYNSVDAFLKDCYRDEFKDKLFDAKDVIVLENDGTQCSYGGLLDVYQKYKKFIVTN